jgi:hypothetical protein
MGGAASLQQELQVQEAFLNDEKFDELKETAQKALETAVDVKRKEVRIAEVALAILAPPLAAKYIADEASHDKLVDDAPRLITFEKAMGEMSSGYASKLKELYHEKRTELTTINMYTLKETYARDTMLECIKQTMIGAKVMEAVKVWQARHVAIKKTPAEYEVINLQFLGTNVGEETRSQLRYDIEFDYDGIRMHTASSQTRYTERVGIDDLYTAFEANQTVDVEEESRAKGSTAFSRKSVFEKTLNAEKKKEAAATLELTRSKGDMSRSLKASQTLDKIATSRSAAEKKFKHWDSQASSLSLTSSRAEQKWMTMTHDPALRPNLYRAGVFSPKTTFSHIAEWVEECPDMAMANGAIMSTVLEGTERNLFNYRKAHHRCSTRMRYITLDDDTLSKGLQKRMTRKTGGIKGDDFKLSKPLEPGKRVDYFVTHVWADDPAGFEKFSVLLEVTNRFEAIHGRKPTFWLDQFCAARNMKPAQSALLMPGTMMSCDRVLVLYTNNLRYRLWCLYELKLLKAMSCGENDHKNRIEIVNLSSDVTLPFTKISLADYSKAECFNKADSIALRSVMMLTPGGKIVLLEWINRLLVDAVAISQERGSAER